MKTRTTPTHRKQHQKTNLHPALHTRTTKKAPGGKVVVFTGLLRLMRSEDELAAVLAHEAAHVLARHPAERMSTANTLALTAFVFNFIMGIPLSPNLLAVGFFLPHSRCVFLVNLLRWGCAALQTRF
jgi:Zn-dependent protease with chaperone function